MEAQQNGKIIVYICYLVTLLFSGRSTGLLWRRGPITCCSHDHHKYCSNSLIAFCLGLLAGPVLPWESRATVRQIEEFVQERQDICLEERASKSYERKDI